HRQCLPFPRLSSSFFFAATAPTDIYTLSLHDALPICPGALGWPRFRILSLGDDYRRRLIRRADLPSEVERELIGQLELSGPGVGDRKSTRLNSSHSQISYAVFCLKKKNTNYPLHLTTR